MLMEHRTYDSHGSKDVKKSRSLDLQSLYGQKPRDDANKKTRLKRKCSPEDGSSAKKKGKKEVLLSSLSSPGNKSRKSLGKLDGAGLASGAGDVCQLEPVSSLELSRNNVLGAVSHNLTDNVVCIPKRRRDFLRRKKADVNLEPKQDESSSGRWSIELHVMPSFSAGEHIASAVLPVEGAGNSLVSTVDLNGILELEGNGTAMVRSNGDSRTTVKQRKTYNLYQESRSKGLSLDQHLEKDDEFSCVYNSDFPSKKARRSSHKGTKVDNSVKETKPDLEDAVRSDGDSQEEDEENLEANAARMLSSRFDPSCTRFCSSGKSSSIASAGGLSFLVSSSRDFTCLPASESDAASADAAAARVLRPRDQHNMNGHFRKRRHFYEVMLGDVNAFWALNRRIKVFWPLDQNWYFGDVIGYDPNKKLYHIKYDDREEEWVDLFHERFKLLLFPSEVPSDVKIKNATRRDKGAVKGSCYGALESNGHVNTFMESEPISSWLARSAQHGKSTRVEITKNQKSSRKCATFQPSASDGKDVIKCCLSTSSVSSDGTNLISTSVSPELLFPSTDGASFIEKSIYPNEKKSPIVYVRKRFSRREDGVIAASGVKSRELCDASFHIQAASVSASSSEIHADEAKSDMLDDGLPRSTGDFGLLKLVISASYMMLLLCKIPLIPWYSFGVENLRLLHAMLMLHHGSLVTVWPNVYLEILFVDNIMGLRFILFKGCLRQALACIFLILSVFHKSIGSWQHSYQQLPATSIRFKFCFPHDCKKGIVSECFYFKEVEDTKWFNLDRKLKSCCLLFKQLLPTECTYDNIKGLESCCQLAFMPAFEGSFSKMGICNIFRQQKRRISGKSGSSVGVMCNAFASKNDEKAYVNYEKTSRLPPFSLLFSAAPTFFLSLHLKLLMERTVRCVDLKRQGPSYFKHHQKNSGPLLDICSRISCSFDTNLGQFPKDSNFDIENNDILAGLGGGEMLDHQLPNCSELEGSLIGSVMQEEMEDAGEIGAQQCISFCQTSDTNHISLSVKGKNGRCPTNGITVETLPFDPLETTSGSSQLNGQHSSELFWNVNDGVSFRPESPDANVSTTWHGDGIPSSGSLMGSISHVLPDSKVDLSCNGFGNGPKKPRTQVFYSLPPGSCDFSPKNGAQHARGFSHKRIRRASEKRTSDAIKSCDADVLSCDANLLVTAADRGWRERGARILLELADQNEWMLVVKVSGTMKYSYKTHQFLQPGSVNRYTHAMMWKGQKHWALEFPDRTQWALFKEMHEECYNRNTRAALVKNIPIPGVHRIERVEENETEVPFVRPALKYIRQVEADVDMAMNPSSVLYDMDSDDDLWISNGRSSDLIQCDISDEMFEKVMDMLEKVAYAKQQDTLSSEELEELLVGIGPSKVIKFIYNYWREKRQKKGLPLIRHFQPPLWEKYQQEMKVWELAMIKRSTSSTNCCNEKPTPVEKPTMFAFCLKPRGLKVPNKGSKQRSQKKLSISAQNNFSPGDFDNLYSYGRRLNGHSFGDERFVYASHNYGSSDSSPVLQASARTFSPRDASAIGYLSLNSDVYERTYYPNYYRKKSKKMGSFSGTNESHMFPLFNQRSMNKKNVVNGWNDSDWSSPMPYHLKGCQPHYIEQLDDSDIDEFRLRDAASAAQHAVNMAKLKREKAQRLLYRADLAIHKAVVALMTAEAIKAASKELSNNI